MGRINFKYLYTLLTLFILTLTMMSCEHEPKNKNPYLHEQGVFEFLGESSDIDEDKELPENIDPEKVLCFGKGLKVGRCISRQLETGICVGLIKDQKHVIAIEVPCESITQDSISIQQELLTE